MNDVHSASQHPPHDDMKFNTTPNILTLIRMGFVPFVVLLLSFQTFTMDVACTVLFAIACITDYFDGYLARTQNVETVYGKLMDPLADKFLVASCLIMLEHLGRIHPVVVMLLICREIAITGLRALASAEGVIIAASGSGKWKTALQMVAIGMIIFKENLLFIPIYLIGTWLLYASLALSLWSAKDYIVDFFRALQESRKTRSLLRKQAREARHAARAARITARAAGKKPLSPS